MRHDMTSSCPPCGHWQQPEEGTSNQPAATLVIVDMQECFLKKIKRRTATIAAVCAEIERSRKLGHDIIVLDWQGCGSTHRGILARLAGYPNWRRVFKSTPSGGSEVRDACAQLGYNTRVFRLVGVYTGACVFQTAKDLTRFFKASMVQVVMEACGTWQKYYDWGIYRLPAVRVRLVHQESEAPLAVPTAG